MTDFARLYPIISDSLGEWTRDTPWALNRGKYEATYSRISIDGRKQVVQVQIAKADFGEGLTTTKIEHTLRAADSLERNGRHFPVRRRAR